MRECESERVSECVRACVRACVCVCVCVCVYRRQTNRQTSIRLHRVVAFVDTFPVPSNCVRWYDGCNYCDVAYPGQRLVGTYGVCARMCVCVLKGRLCHPLLSSPLTCFLHAAYGFSTGQCTAQTVPRSCVSCLATRNAWSTVGAGGEGWAD